LSESFARVRTLLEEGSPVLLDGALGSELVRRGVRWRGHGLRTDPDAVAALHDEYSAAGADVIRTNTFQLNDRIYRNVFRDLDHMRRIGAPGLEARARDLTRKAVELARSASRSAERSPAVAGVIGTLEHPFRPDLAPDPEAARAEHATVAGWLAEAGVDLLILESMNTVAEARAAAEAAMGTGLPVWAGFVVGPEGAVLGGEPLSEAAKAMAQVGVEAVLANCTPPEVIEAAVATLRDAVDLPVGAYAHVGRFDPPSWKFEFHPRWTDAEEWPPDRYAETASRWIETGARIVGGCCGTGPGHIRALREAL
jgi:homocysteine S-methyltransferase